MWVRHRFTLGEAVEAVLDSHAAAHGGTLSVAVGELSVLGVRVDLKRAGRGRQSAGTRVPPVDPDCVVRRCQVARVRGQLVRLGMFPATAGSRGDCAAQEVVVEHQFTFAEAVAAVMGVKSMVRPAPGRRIVPLTAGEVRSALWWSAEHGPDRVLLERWRAEPEDGPLNRLAGWVRGELTRLRVFTGPPAERG
ncbi:hypothetical protein SAMN05421854_10391 [Amycolatopsis rubida]|uniref:Uncharacterized protein n=2 Tax=Amycolatopsis rubida TaxID=112413 RepID=A0A1I5K993_9PSEU|nr:hypothetical protein SAMN05421854_10391 [Amycolatopsis rubida]